MNKSNAKYPLSVGKEFSYRNQKYIVEQEEDIFSCSACKEVNAQYIKDNPVKCVSFTKTGTPKFSCYNICGPFCYPKRIK